MKHVKLDTNVFLPMPVTLVGSVYEEAPTFMAVGWATRVNATPPQIGVGIHWSHVTAEAIKENNAFSVCLVDRPMLERADYCGMVSAKNTDKSSIFKCFYGSLKAAPMIEEAPLCFECALVKTVEGKSNMFFIGDVVGTYARLDCVESGRVDPQKAGFLFLTMPDNTYWELGAEAGKAWSMGRSFKSTE